MRNDQLLWCLGGQTNLLLHWKSVTSRPYRVIPYSELKLYPWHQTFVVVFWFLCFAVAQEGAECGDGVWSLTLSVAAQVLVVH